MTQISFTEYHNLLIVELIKLKFGDMVDAYHPPAEFIKEWLVEVAMEGYIRHLEIELCAKITMNAFSELVRENVRIN